MAAGPCNLQHVDSAIVKAILGRGTKLTHSIGSSSDKWSREREQSLLIGQTHAGPLLKTLSVSLAMSLAFSISAL